MGRNGDGATGRIHQVWSVPRFRSARFEHEHEDEDEAPGDRSPTKEQHKDLG